MTPLQQTTLITVFFRISALLGKRPVKSIVILSFVALGLLLMALTFNSIAFIGEVSQPKLLNILLLVDLVYALIIAGLVALRITRLILARRSKSVGSRLHVRLTSVFIFIALMPTVIVAIFATFSINYGLEGWFSDNVQRVVRNSMESAQAYEFEHRRDVRSDAIKLASVLSLQKQMNPTIGEGNLRKLLSQSQPLSLSEAFIVDYSGNLRLRGEKSYLFDFEEISPEDLKFAAVGDVVIIEDWHNNEFRALVQIDGFANRLLYVSRKVDGNILSLLDETQENVLLYNQIESERSQLLFSFGLIYLAFSIVVLLCAVWFALWFAEKLARPVGELAGAAQKVGSGNLEIQVPEESGEDEIALLGRAFNKMIKRVKIQRDTLLQNNSEIEKRKRLFETVIGNVSGGIIGLNPDGRIDVINPAAQTILQLQLEPNSTNYLPSSVPEFLPLFNRAKVVMDELVQDQIKIIRDNVYEDILLKITTRRASNGAIEGFVITFDDLTDLVSAQRYAAWGDIAQRIAHEIKNPLTPIKLSAEKLKLKFATLVGNERSSLENYSDMIIRQTDGLRRMVDEFSEFARMPEPDKTSFNLIEILAEVVLLQTSAHSDVTISMDSDEEPVICLVDPTLINQVFNNLFKNAIESIETAVKQGLIGSKYDGLIKVEIDKMEQTILIKIIDNGVGLPKKKNKLFEPYVTSRENGIGLGLAIVKKIIDEHDGQLSLLDAKDFQPLNHRGAVAQVSLPIVSDPEEQISLF